MILLTILLFTVLLLITIVVGGISLFGTIGIVIFGDIIVCVGVIVLMIYFIIRRKRKKK